MEYRTLGNTGLKVSEIGLGAAQIGNPDLPEARVEQALNRTLDLGINFIDTAAMYGESEARIGKYISRRKDEFIVATKCGDYQEVVDGKRQTVKDYTSEGILRTIDESRRKLRMDVIDIVQFHGLPGDADDEAAAFEALLKAREKGWTRFVGVSHDGAAAASAAQRWPLDTQEFTYNILYQEADTDLVPTLREQGMGAIIKRPIANAVYLREDRPGGDYSGNSWDRARQFPLQELAGGMPPVEFVLRFTLSHPDVSTAIVGSTNPENIEANARVSDGQRLPDGTLQKAKDAFKERFGSQ